MLNIPAWNFDLSLLSSLFAESEQNDLGFEVDELQRRMAIIGSAGVTDVDDFKRFVLSTDAG
jgi:hypothetical protein